MSDAKIVAVTVLAMGLFTFGFTIGLHQGISQSRRIFNQDAIQHGFAEYNQTNGVWQWRTNR